MAISGTDFTGESTPVAAGTVTVLSGTTFALSRPDGNVDVHAPLGFFSQDRRLLSRWVLEVDGHAIEPLAHFLDAPWRCRFLGRVVTSDLRLLVERGRYVDEAMREDVVVTNLAGKPVTVTVRMHLGTDFASLFDVKEARPATRPAALALPESGSVLLTGVPDGKSPDLAVRVRSADGSFADGAFVHHVTLEARTTWRTIFQVLPVIEGETLVPRFPAGRSVDETAAARREQAWQARSSEITSTHEGLHRAVRRSHDDLGSLRIFPPVEDDATEAPLPAVAAGSPWFMTLFGRDSLLTAYMTLLLDPSLADGVMTALADRQGVRVDPVTEEQPGRILHEVRYDEQQHLGHGGQQVYYGSVDATPLFVALLGEYARWHGRCEAVERLLPAADRALQWIEDYGDPDGDGFVEYQRLSPDGLVNQGWKDSWDGINFASGTIAHAPIALCEVQGYVYAAYRARGALAELFGDREQGREWVRRAEQLKVAFNERFWLPDLGWYAIGLDADKRPIDALGSNMGQALAMGIVDRGRAPLVAERLLSPELFSGWGIRTLATTMGAYDPLSYHNGSVWPHDTALIAYGLMRGGFTSEGQRVAAGLLDAAEVVGGRLPELFAGLAREVYPEPVPYATACSPQAWASAAPIHLVRALIGLEPSVPAGMLRMRPRLPEELGTVRLSGLPLAGGRIDVRAQGRHAEAGGLPAGLEWVTTP